MEIRNPTEAERNAQPWKGYLYHKEYAPEGRIFDRRNESFSLEVLASEGWVDSPAKIGVNKWNTGDCEEEVRERAGQFERNELPAIDELAPQHDAAARAKAYALEAENHRLNQEIRELQEQIRANESDAKKAAMYAEELEDERSDARKKKGRKQPDLVSGIGKTGKAGRKKKAKPVPAGATDLDPTEF